jgi:hypothetical protein
MTVDQRRPESADQGSARDGQIVVLGGYGAVGQVVARTLSRWYAGRVVVAGRDMSRAEALAGSTRGAVQPWRVDVEDDDDVQRAIEGARVVVMSVERANERVARACLQRGVRYVDVSASASVLTSISRLHDLAVERGSTAVLSVGLAPGLTNLLARQAAQLLTAARAVDITVLLGLGEHHGADAVRWTIDNLSRSVERGAAPIRPARVQLPGFGLRTAYPFPFSDQYTLRETLGLSATTRLCFDSAPLTGALFALRSSGFFALMRRLRLDGLLASSLARVRVGGDQFVVRATASDLHGTTVACAATGRNEGRATGIVAAHVVRVLDRAAPPAGVVHIEQLVNPSAFFTDLAEDGIVFHQL